MKIKFNGHSPSEREVEISQEELSELFKVMCNHFLVHIEYGTFNSRYPFDDEEKIASLCNKHQVDVNYTKDRLAFFKEIVANMQNPYE